MLKRIIRGCTDLPGVGPHPGTGTLIAFTLMGAAAGAKGGWAGAVGGGLIALVFTAPFYLIGAYDRAKISERFVKQGGKIDD